MLQVAKCNRGEGLCTQGTKVRVVREGLCYNSKEIVQKEFSEAEPFQDCVCNYGSRCWVLLCHDIEEPLLTVQRCECRADSFHVCEQLGSGSIESTVHEKVLFIFNLSGAYNAFSLVSRQFWFESPSLFYKLAHFATP